MYIHIHIYTYVRTYTHTYMYIHTYVHTYMHTYMHTYIYSLFRSEVLLEYQQLLLSLVHNYSSVLSKCPAVILSSLNNILLITSY